MYLWKYYIIDIGLRNYLFGLHSYDSRYVIENIAFIPAGFLYESVGYFLVDWFRAYMQYADKSE